MRRKFIILDEVASSAYNVKCAIFFLALFFVFYILHSTFYIPFAHAQVTPCPTSATNSSATTVINGLITGGSVSSFSSDTGNCISSITAKIATYKLPSYADLKSLFYTQLKPIAGTGGVGKYPTDSTQPQVTESNFVTYTSNLNNQNTTILVTGDLHITSPTQLSGIYSGVIFIDGSLYIGSPTGTLPGESTNQGQLVYGANGISGLVFIVRDNINIDKSMTRVDAVLISGGQICSAYDVNNSGVCPTNGTPTSYITPLNNTPLLINGALISLTNNPNQNIKFSRALFDNTLAAEQVRTDPKYLVVLKNLFTQNFTVQSNVSASTINAGSQAICTPYCPPPSSIACGQQIYNGCGGTTNSSNTACGTGTLCSGSNTCSQGSCSAITIGSVTVSPSSVTHGTQVSVSWAVQNPSKNCSSGSTCDVLALYSVNTSGGDFISQLSTSCVGTSGKASGTCSYLIPSFVPQNSNGYVIKYITNGNYTSPTATSNVFNIN